MGCRAARRIGGDWADVGGYCCGSTGFARAPHRRSLRTDGGQPSLSKDQNATPATPTYGTTRTFETKSMMTTAGVTARGNTTRHIGSRSAETASPESSVTVRRFPKDSANSVRSRATCLIIKEAQPLPTNGERTATVAV